MPQDIAVEGAIKLISVFNDVKVIISLPAALFVLTPEGLDSRRMWLPSRLTTMPLAAKLGFLLLVCGSPGHNL